MAKKWACWWCNKVHAPHKTPVHLTEGNKVYLNVTYCNIVCQDRDKTFTALTKRTIPKWRKE